MMGDNDITDQLIAEKLQDESSREKHDAKRKLDAKKRRVTRFLVILPM
jgi:hypothetical protein